MLAPKDFQIFMSSYTLYGVRKYVMLEAARYQLDLKKGICNFLRFYLCIEPLALHSKEPFFLCFLEIFQEKVKSGNSMGIEADVQKQSPEVFCKKRCS